MKPLNLQDRFNKLLPADPLEQNSRRQVTGACYSFVRPKQTAAPKLIHVSDEMMEELGIDASEKASEEFLKIFSGNAIIEGSNPYAMCYGGHQFGHWAGQLGDGRAINLGELVHNEKRWALQLKGAGETPYSRNADGLAVLRSSIREHLCSEAMYHLGVPTTRSLSLSLTGDQVLRDMMYDGNAAYEKGAVVCRVSPSFIRFGSFEIFAHRGDVKNLRILADYTISEFFPAIEQKTKAGYIQFFNAVVDATLELIIAWQRVGFVHGVMNTDNMSILGLTIDYGPYGWLEGYDPQWTPNTTDRQTKRYRFGNQPTIGLWNLYQLANALHPLLEEATELEAALERYKKEYVIRYPKMMRSKLGLIHHKEGDNRFAQELEEVFVLTETDMTIFFRNLAKISKTMSVDQALDTILDAFYNPEELRGKVKENWENWLGKYIKRIAQEELSDQERSIVMNKVNPKYVLRNYIAQLIIDKADQGDYSLLNDIHALLKQPYKEQPEYEQWFSKRPEWARHKVGCSMLSCSS